MEKLSILLFGLDETILAQLSTKERDKFTFLSWQFLIQFLCILVGMSYFFFLLTNSYLLSGIIGLLFGTVIGSVLRFTVISIGIPLTQSVTPIAILKRWVNLIRILLYALYCFVSLITFLSLFHHNSLNSNIQNHRENIVTSYERLLDKRFENLMQENKKDLLNREKEIKVLKVDYESTQDYEKKNILLYQIKKKKEKYELKSNSYKIQTKKTQDNLTKELKSYSTKIADEDFPFTRFDILMGKGSFVFILIVFVLAFSSLIIQYIRAVTGNENSYFALCSKLYSERVSVDYQLMQNSKISYLLEKYKVNWSPIAHYEDPPFNEKRIVLETELKNSSLFNEWKNRKSI
jgi:hypothetical protein